jgi:thiamine biosynthesis protein ThiS
VEGLGCGVDGVKRNLILILEDNQERIAGFQRASAKLTSQPKLRFWHDARSMIFEMDALLPEALLVSLDHDLNPRPGSEHDPGTGLEVADHLAKLSPICPVILHSSNYERVWSMHNELTHAGWHVERVGPLGVDWIETSWLNRVCELLKHMKPDDMVTANGQPVTASLPCSIEEFLVAQGLLPRSVVVEQNGKAVAPSEFAKRQLNAGDKLEIVKIVAGG